MSNQDLDLRQADEKNGQHEPASQREPQEKRRRRTPEATNENPPSTKQRKPEKTNAGADKWEPAMQHTTKNEEDEHQSQQMGPRHATRSKRRRQCDPPRLTRAANGTLDSTSRNKRKRNRIHARPKCMATTHRPTDSLAQAEVRMSHHNIISCGQTTRR